MQLSAWAAANAVRRFPIPAGPGEDQARRQRLPGESTAPASRPAPMADDVSKRHDSGIETNRITCILLRLHASSTRLSTSDRLLPAEETGPEPAFLLRRFRLGRRCGEADQPDDGGRTDGRRPVSPMRGGAGFSLAADSRQRSSPRKPWRRDADRSRRSVRSRGRSTPCRPSTALGRLRSHR